MRKNNISKSKLAIFLVTSVVLFVAVITYINYDTANTARRYCSLESPMSRYCRYSSDSEDDNDQIKMSMNPKHLFLSDLAFRNIFVPFGFEPGTMSYFYVNNEAVYYPQAPDDYSNYSIVTAEDCSDYEKQKNNSAKCAQYALTQAQNEPIKFYYFRIILIALTAIFIMAVLTFLMYGVTNISALKRIPAKLKR